MHRTYLAIDLKSYYASAECASRHLRPAYHKSGRGRFLPHRENYLSRCVSFPKSLWYSGSRQTVRGRAKGQGGQCKPVKGSGTIKKSCV